MIQRQRGFFPELVDKANPCADSTIRDGETKLIVEDWSDPNNPQSREVRGCINHFVEDSRVGYSSDTIPTLLVLSTVSATAAYKCCCFI